MVMKPNGTSQVEGRKFRAWPRDGPQGQGASPTPGRACRPEMIKTGGSEIPRQALTFIIRAGSAPQNLNPPICGW